MTATQDNSAVPYGVLLHQRANATQTDKDAILLHFEHDPLVVHAWAVGYHRMQSVAFPEFQEKATFGLTPDYLEWVINGQYHITIFIMSLDGNRWINMRSTIFNVHGRPKLNGINGEGIHHFINQLICHYFLVLTTQYCLHYFFRRILI